MGGTRTVPPTGTRRPAVNRDQMARKVVAALGAGDCAGRAGPVRALPGQRPADAGAKEHALRRDRLAVTGGRRGGIAYILLHHTIYFHGNGTAQALVVLLTYLVVGAVTLGGLDWRRPEPPVPADATEAAAMVVPIGATP